MTRAQELLMKYIHKNFVEGSIQTEWVSGGTVKVTDKNGESMLLTMNLFGDIMDAETKKIYAEGNVPHNLDILMKNPYQLPTDWMELPRT